MAGRSNGTSHGYIPGEPVKLPRPPVVLSVEEEAEAIVRGIRLRMISPQDGVRAIVRLVEERSRQQEQG